MPQGTRQRPACATRSLAPYARRSASSPPHDRGERNWRVRVIPLRNIARAMRRLVLFAMASAFVQLGSPAVAASASTPTSTMFQVDAAHSGYIYGAGVLPPLTKAWVLQGISGMPYTPIANGKAFVLHLSGEHQTLQLLAVDLATGKVAWQRTLADWAGSDWYAAVDDGRVFVAQGGRYPADSASGAVMLFAFDAS